MFTGDQQFEAGPIPSQLNDERTEDRPVPATLTSFGLSEQELGKLSVYLGARSEHVQCVYPLLPLQEGMLFECLRGGNSDAYIFSTLFTFHSSDRLNAWLQALNRVIARHEVLRLSVAWETLERPVQIIHRHALIPLHELALNPGQDPLEQLLAMMRPGRQQHLDLGQAPLGRVLIAGPFSGGRYYALLVLHHLISDLQSLKLMIDEVMALLEGHDPEIELPPDRYQEYVIERLQHLQSEEAAAVQLFRKHLHDVTEPTTAFAVSTGDAAQLHIEEAVDIVGPSLTRKVRAQARRCGVSAARLFHAAFGVLIALTSGRDDVIYGTVLSISRHGHARPGLHGLTVNTLPLRLRLSGLTVRSLVDHTHRQLLDLLQYPASPLALAQPCTALAGGAPLFNSIFNYRRSQHETQWITPSGVSVLARGEAPTHYPIVMSVDDRDDHFVLTAHTCDACLSAQRLTGYLTRTIESLVEALEDAPHTLALDLNLIPHPEWLELIRTFNATYHERQRPEFVHEWFQTQVRATPLATAVLYQERSLSYHSLDAHANRLARELVAAGVGPDQLVGIFTERSLEMVIAVLGTLKAGGAYVPLDSAYPAAWLAAVLREAAPKVLLVQEGLQPKLPDGVTMRVIAVDSNAGLPATQDEPDLAPTARGLAPHHLAYVIYTSGSTGAPKGVMIPHRGLTNYLQWALRTYHPGTGVGIVSSPLAFDATITSLYGPLLSGGCVVLLPSGEEIEGLEHRLRRSCRWSLLKIAPAHLQAVAESLRGIQPLAAVDTVVVGGEAFAPQTAQLCQSLWPQSRLVNEYGPTETVVGCMAYTVLSGAVPKATIPIGRPIDNTQIYILNRRGRPVPIGAIGEVFIGGSGVARGYLHQPDLTAERFVADPFSTVPGATMYRTGDLARWLPDGMAEYVGREDQQVKIRGFRIEPAEVDAQLRTHPRVRDVAVLAREGASGERQLVAYVVAHDTPADTRDNPDPPVSAQLREHLKQALPAHMIPSAWVMLEQLPLTPNGKLDRRALPVPQRGADELTPYVGTQTAVEQTLALIWERVLKIDRVARHDNFFELGGHSLLATRVVAHVRDQLGVELPIRAVFDAPTLYELAARTEVERVRQDRSLETHAAHSTNSALGELSDDQLDAEIAQLEHTLRQLKAQEFSGTLSPPGLCPTATVEPPAPRTNHAANG